MRHTKAFFLTLIAIFTSLCLWAQSPRADFSSDITSGCSPIIVNFQDKSSGNITSWKWDFGNGSTSTRQTPSTTFITAGTYTVKLVVSNANGSDSITKTAYITAYDVPNVNFSTDKTTSCAPGSIQFKDNSAAAPGTTNTSWQWEFGDGATATGQNTVHTYTNPGVYSVLLKVTNDKGCVKAFPKSNSITIYEGVAAAFSNTSPDLCRAPASVSFTNESAGQGTLTSTWIFGDGSTSRSQNPSHTYSREGSYSVSLIVSSSLGCSDTLTKDSAVKIGGTNSNFTNIDSLCATSNIRFSNTSMPAPVNYQWIFPDGTTSNEVYPVKKFGAPGSYTVKLVNDYENCRDTVAKTITISGKPTVGFTSPDTLNCQVPTTVIFQNSSNGAVSYEWLFGDGNSSTSPNPSNTYSTFGDYSVSLKATNAAGCFDSLTKVSYIKIQKPVISIENLPVKGCVPYTINPKAVVTSLDSVVNYQWNFGDGGTATGQLPSYTYTQQGTYDVTVTITTTKGCTETFTLNAAVKVGTKPKADFTADNTDVCASQPVKFTNLSPDPTDEYLWKFGDGGSSTLKEPAYQFKDTGKISVTLISYNNGCGDTLTKNNFVRIKPPISRFSYRPDCNNRLNYTFTDSSIGATSWTWNFGDGSPSVNGKNPAPHNFPRRGAFIISLTTTNAECSFTQTTVLRIVDQTPDFTTASQVGCKTYQPTFNPYSPVRITAFQWDFGNGKKSNILRPTTIYSTPGSYTVTLTTTDIYGCKDTRTKENFIRVNGPTAAFTSLANRHCIGQQTTFADSSKTDGTNPIVKWQWDFGDGTGQSSDQLPSYTYDTAGAFDVKLIVEDATGCKDSLTKNDYVQISSLKAAWEAVEQSCPKAPVTFRNTTMGTFASRWSFGDSTFSTRKSPSHAYADTGKYTISLVVFDSIGCRDTLTRENYLYIGKPVASFTANNLITYCSPFEARFTNTSQYYNSFVWSFLSGTSKTKDPITFFTKTGSYKINLTVTSPGGCKDSVSQTLQVKNVTDSKITYTPLEGCTPITVNMQTSDSLNAKFTWDFGDGNTVDTNVNKISHTYTDFGKFIPKVIIEEQCIAGLGGIDTIYVYGVDARFVVNKNLVCDTGIVAFTDSTVMNDRAQSYKWDFGDGGFSNQQSPVHFYNKLGAYTIRLDVQTQQGCTDSAFFSVVKVAQSPKIAIRGDTAICMGDYIQYQGNFTRSDTAVTRWLWQFPNGKRSAVQNPEVQWFPVPGDYRVRTLVTNSSGCMDSAFLPLHVKSKPTINMPPSLTFNNGPSLTIPATYSAGVTSYTWTPSEGLSCTNCPQPEVTTKFNTKYTVTVTDGNGCSNTDFVQIIVPCKNAEVFVPNSFSPNGDGSNDIFYVRGKGIDRVKTLRIFNRWGQVVFEKRDIQPNIENTQNGWDGKFNGAKPNPDVYIYQLEIYCENGEILRFEGNVALLL
ncbi:PKD domain-containing protein [Chitinophagaceae bacterium LB-8]|uniref:PKD domain-containing protein n=1 Tax=Paraflavisolibacter caeni TaxID=2982496 RepID=A0A9X3BHC7_9BACT|nr:PKD domain-containing protein [Paraflavisolibacter caeni]MCU7548678.1 PKD domain-containing protein [Paraflavisolibacter caeni]